MLSHTHKLPSLNVHSAAGNHPLRKLLLCNRQDPALRTALDSPQSMNALLVTSGDLWELMPLSCLLPQHIVSPAPCLKNNIKNVSLASVSTW